TLIYNARNEKLAENFGKNSQKKCDFLAKIALFLLSPPRLTEHKKSGCQRQPDLCIIYKELI
ncbi:MAG: hypothetical protein J6Y01_04120, partial [Spirochaetales bacterium]|nr:hypothetical protein [Spirochaetales bacterium]